MSIMKNIFAAAGAAVIGAFVLGMVSDRILSETLSDDDAHDEEVCRRYIDMAWNTMTSVSVRFVTSPVKSEYAQLTASTVNCFIKPRV